MARLKEYKNKLPHRSMKNPSSPVDHSRRGFVLGASSMLALSCLPQSFLGGQALWAAPRPASPVLSGRDFQLRIGQQRVNFTGRERIATTVNHSLPAPILRWREGDRIRITVLNDLDSTSSIHWHGMILPSEMDGVPGLSFDGIAAGKSFTYEFDVQQSGTYWYHSHSDFQEQTGLYGAIVIEPRHHDPVHYDREHVIVLSDWSDEDPHRIYAKLKKESHYYNTRRRTLGDFFKDVDEKGFRNTIRDRDMWNDMRMAATDISDVTGYTYTFLMNGVTPDQGWHGLFTPGEKVRLRIVNAAAMTLFDVRIPGLKMTVVAADGQNVKPIDVDEFRIGPAETYDVIVQPRDAGAHTVFAQAIDRSGFARGTLASAEHLYGDIPAMDPAPTLTHRDMGMGHGDHGNSHSTSHGEHSAHRDHPEATKHTGHGSAHDSAQQQPKKEDAHAGHTPNSNMHGDHSSHGQHAAHGPHSQASKTDEHQHHGNAMQMREAARGSGLGKAGFGSNFQGENALRHVKTEFGPHVDMRVDAPQNGLHDPGVGLREHHKLGRRVLSYADLRNMEPTRDKRQPTREIHVHLTGNMQRYMWSMNGVEHHDAPPLQLQYGERVRIVLVNDTMMTHPIHLHGLWSELETGDPDYIPRKHTILVQPGSTISYLVTADAKGRWAYHCHLMFHMGGMMREVRVG